MLGNYASLAQHLDLADVRLSLPRPDDLAPHRTNWKVAGDMSQTEVEERCQTLRRVVQRRFPAFAASYFPALLYATHYHSRDLTDLVRHSREHSFHDKRQGDGQHPRRRSEVVSGVFRFDLAALKYHSHGSATPLQHPAICLLDGPSGPVLRVPARIAQVLMLADGTRSQETIAQTLAARVGTSEAVARTECMTLLRLYGTFLEQTDG